MEKQTEKPSVVCSVTMPWVGSALCSMTSIRRRSRPAFSKARSRTQARSASIKRLYVHETVYDELCNEVVAIAKNTVVVDDGSKQGTKLGPL